MPESNPNGLMQNPSFSSTELLVVDPSVVIKEAFPKAINFVLKQQEDGRFQKACAEQGINTFNDVDKPEYWATFNVFTQDKCQNLIDGGANLLQVRALQLVGSTPNYIFQKLKLDEFKSIGFDNLTPAQKSESRDAKITASLFNNAIRQFAEENPATNAQDLSAGLQIMLPFSIEGEVAKQAAKTRIEEAIRGAQHEKGYGQILAKSGIPFRPATAEEDIRGIDYVLYEGTSKEMNIDVKASLSEIEALGSAGAYARKPGNKVVMYSLIKDREFGGKLGIPDDLAAEKAVALEHLLAEAA